jgi:hypothetical protein
MTSRGADPPDDVDLEPDHSRGGPSPDDFESEAAVVPLLLPDESPASSARRISIPPAPSIRVPAPDSIAPDAWSIDRHGMRSSPPPLRRQLRPTRNQRVVRGPSEEPPPLHGHALDLVDRSVAPLAAPLVDLTSEMTDRYELGDFSGALVAAEMVLARDPDDAAARQYAAACRERLEQFYVSRVGSLTRVPIVTVRDVDLRWLGLDHRAGFLLSRIDGHASLEEVLDVSGMPRLEALRTLVELCDAGALSFDR